MSMTRFHSNSQLDDASTLSVHTAVAV